MNVAVSKPAAPADELVSVVARGCTIVDATGAHILAGNTAQVLASEVARLIEAGLIVDPADKPAEQIARHTGEAGRHAWNLFVVSQNAVGVAAALRPSQPGAALRAKQLIGYADEIRRMAEQLLQVISAGEQASGSPRGT